MNALGLSEAESVSTKNGVRSNAKRILVVCHAWYGDLIGGSFRLATEFAVDLAAAGHDVTYVCAQAGKTAQDEVIDGVHVVRYPQRDEAQSRFQKLRHHVKRTAEVVRALREANPIDALSGHSPLQFLGACRSLRGADCRRSYVVHSPFDDEQRSNSTGAARWTSSVATWTARYLERWNLRTADVIQTVSHFTLSELVAKHGQPANRKGVVAPGWVDTESFQPADSRVHVRTQLGTVWDTDLPVFFTLRRLEQRMGIETLVAAADRLKESGAEFRVLIGGAGSQKGRYEKQARELGLLDGTVHFLGRLEDAEVASAYAAADCFVLPTRALECFGLIVLEALASGTPVIASDVAAIPELASLQGDGWMFPPGDDAALAERMDAFLKGTLRPSVDLRHCALSFRRPAIMRRWEELLLSPVISDG